MKFPLFESCLYYLFNLIHIYFLEDKVDLSSEDGTPDFRFAKWLSKNKKLQGIPPSAFFSEGSKSIGENYIRFCFIKVRIFYINYFIFLISSFFGGLSLINYFVIFQYFFFKFYFTSIFSKKLV